MTGLPKNIPADTHQERAAWRTSRDRVLLYLRGLDLPPFEDLDLALRQPIQLVFGRVSGLCLLLRSRRWSRGPCVGELFEELGRHQAGEGRFTPRNPLEQIDQLVGLQIFQQITLRSALDGLEKIVAVIRHGQHDDLDVGHFGLQAAHRFQAMTDYQRNVLMPALREEAQAAGAKLRSLLPRRMRKGLVDDGRWLSPEAREQMQQWIAQRPRISTLVEYRRRLAAVLEARTSNAGEALQNLQAWCREAEASGIRALQEYSARLKGYTLQTARA